MATAGVVVGLALATTSSYADTKPTPVGTTIGRLTHKARPAGGSSAVTKAKAKVVAHSPVHKFKIRIKARSVPLTRVTRKTAVVRSHRATTVVRTGTKRAPRPTAVRHRISTVQRKAAPAPTVRMVRKATTPRTQLRRVTAAPTEINKTSSKIIKSSVHKPTLATRNPSSSSAERVQTRPVEAKISATVLRQPGVEVALTTPAVAVAGLPVGGGGVSAVVAPEITVWVLPVEVPVSPVEAIVPGLSLPTVALPPRELPAVTVSPDDPLTVIRAGSKAAIVGPLTRIGQRTAPADGQATAGASEETAATPGSLLAKVSTTVLAAYTLALSLHDWAMSSIGPSALSTLDELGRRITATEVPTFVGPTTALVLAGAIGAAATGTASSGSASASGLAALVAALGLPALSESRRLRGRLRESAFRRPRLPGFAPD